MSTSKHKSVLFLIADDWSRIAGCYGNPVIRTPNIDRFAAKGTVFERGFCTSPSCAVSRACILTGQHSHTHGQYGHCHGIHGFRTHENMTSGPKLMKQLGYATALIGKKHVAPDSVYPFDYEPTIDHRSPADIADKVRTFLDANPDRPFYCHVASTYPHRSGRGFGTEHEAPGYQKVTYDPDAIIVPDFLPDIPDVRRDLANYYSGISAWDQVVGAVLDTLQASGRADETLVIVTTDHAMPFPGAKASSFDTGHNCPLIVRSPDQDRRGLRNHAMVNWCDFLPTFLDYCGIEYPGDATPLPGKSFLPILEDDSPQPGDGAWEQTYFSHNFHEVTNYYPYRVLHGRRYKLVRNLAHQLPTPLPSDLFRSYTWTAVRRDNVEMLGTRPRQHFVYQPAEALYDLDTDPTEATNLIDEPALREMVDQMRRELMEFRIRTRDPWLELSWQHGDPCAVAPSDL